MAKLAIFAFLLVQLCIFMLRPATTFRICLHAGNGILMTDQDVFGSTIKNFGFHKDGWSANVNWGNKEVDVPGWGRFKFPSVQDDGYRAIFDGCWDSSGGNCNSFKDKAKCDCDAALKF
ncbi:hypothetical protein BGX33_004332 [Mortierella sp. NVP41]|nr:hypothetical protein BGX33_004332 [Mortierella sp. NVP41]